MARPEGVEQTYMLLFLFIFLSSKGNKAHFYPIKNQAVLHAASSASSKRANLSNSVPGAALVPINPLIPKLLSSLIQKPDG